jgi:hypothetical protein
MGWRKWRNYYFGTMLLSTKCYGDVMKEDRMGNLSGMLMLKNTKE